MAFDGIILKKVIDELQILENAKVNKIFQPSNNNIVINVYRGKNYSINIDVSASDYGIYITKHNKKNPITQIFDRREDKKNIYARARKNLFY